MLPRLHASMLGRFEIWEKTSHREQGESRVLPLPSTTKSRSLLAYLLLHRDVPLSRETLTEMFWPGRPPHRARRSLSTALWRIRRSFAPLDPLQCDRQFVHLAYPGEVQVDVEMFEKNIQRAIDVESLQAAVALYRGDFLPSFYEDWVVQQRGWVQAQFQDALLQLMAAYENRNDHLHVLATAQQVLSLDKCNEAAHRAAMRAYAGMGQRTEALAQYRRCQDTLARELGVEPSAKTQAQYQQLLNRESSATVHPIAISTPTTPPLACPPSSTSNFPSPLVGRDKHLAYLLTRWREAEEGHGKIVFLRGEAGIGKTRLLATLADAVRHERSSVIISVQCYEYERGEPYGALVEITQEAIAAGGEHLIQTISPWHLASLTQLVPKLRSRLPADMTHPTVSAEQKHLLQAITRLLIALARQSPLLLLLDDLQWAHRSMLAWLPALSRNISTEPMLIVGAYRIEEVVPSDLLSRIIFDLGKTGDAESLTLERLSTRYISQWLPGLDASVLERIHRHTEGNPFFILETIRALMERGHLRMENGTYHLQEDEFAPPLPDSVRQAVEIRLDRLTPAARQGLSAAAVLGRVFDLDVWIQTWMQDEERALEVLDELLRSHLIQEGKGAFARDYAFEHHLVRETVYQGIPKRHRWQLHLASARALKRLREDEPGIEAEIASHYLRAGETRQALPWLLRAGNQAVAVAATGEALEFYRQALANYHPDEMHQFERAVLERKIGETHFHRGEYRQAEHHLLHALELADRPLPPPGLPMHGTVGASLMRQIGHRILPGAVRAFSSQAQVTPALREEVAVYTSLGWIYSLQSRYEDYLLVSLRALNRSENAGYDRGIAVAATALGLAADFIGWFGIAGRLHQQAQAVVTALEHPLDVSFVSFGQSYHAYLVGDEETMLQQARLAAENYRQVGDVHRWSLAMTLQAYVLTYRGRLREVRRMGEEIARVGQEVQDIATQCAGETLLGLADRWQGHWAAAIRHYRRASDLARQIPDYMNLVENLSELACCLLRLGRWAETQEILSQACETAKIHEIQGDTAGKLSLGISEGMLWAVEHLPDARPDHLVQAGKSVRETRRRAKKFRPAIPEAWRLYGRYEWLRGHPEAACSWWKKSLAQAEVQGHPLDWGVTALEMGLRLGDETWQKAGRERLDTAGAGGEGAFMERLVLHSSGF